MMISIRRIISPFVLAGILMVGIMTRKIVSNILASFLCFQEAGNGSGSNGRYLNHNYYFKKAYD